MRSRFPVFCRPILPLLLLILTTVSVSVSVPVSVSAQEQSIPSANYDWGLTLLRDGKTLDAQKQFAKELNSGFKIATERWLDSICYAAMLGESQYQLGQNGPALENFNTAIRISIQYSNWLANVQNLPNPGAFTLKPVPWGDPNPGRRLLNVPGKFPVLFGDLNYADKYRTGGVAMAPQLKPIRGVEIARCTMLAMRRRAELLGPLGAGDELNNQFINQTSNVQRSLAGTWFQAWLDIEVGLGKMAMGMTDEAAMALQKGALINGSAHPLSVIAYLELGKLQLKASKYEKAYNYFLEAATIAFYYEDVEGMTEAFENLETAYCLRNPQMICPPLAQAAEWAKFKKLPLLYSTVQTAAADDFLRLRQFKPAADSLLLAEKAVGKPDQYVLKGRLGSTINYQKARIAFQNPAPASQANGYAFLGASMEFMRFGGVWNFQINQVDAFLLTGQTPRKALELYSLLLREPTALDWALDPIEAMSVTLTPRPGTWENFFLCAIDMERKEEALEISERARKAAFLQTLDLGGRVHALRLLLEGPEKDLTVTQAQRKRDVLMEYPAFENCSKKVRDLQVLIRKMSLPVTAAQKNEQREVADALKKVAELSRMQEAILMSMALDRRVIEILFPKVRTCKEIQESLPKGEALLICFAARNQMFYFLMNNERMAMWKIFDSGSGSGSSRKNKAGTNLLTSLQTNFASMLREIGLGSGTIPVKTLQESAWKKSSQRVMADLTKNSQANFASADFSSLVIVPDRFMWYLPFEALQIQTAKGARPTISQFSIRYAPMASLATPWKKTQYPKSPYSIIVAGKNAPSERAVERLEKTLERPVLFEEKSFGGIQPGTPGTNSSVFAPEFDKMFVFDDLKNTEGDSYGIFPMALDRTSREGSLGYWFLLPSGSPRLIVLGGMRTRCENLAKKTTSAKTKPSQYVPGQELFLTSMAFLANGAETVVLPRWRLEGDSPWKLAAHFNAQLPTTENSADAWRRAVLKFSAGDVPIQSEPRIGKSDEVDVIPASHPLFWAGFMLVDSGSGALRSKERLALAEDGEPEEAENAGPAPQEEKPAVEEKPAENAQNQEESAPENVPVSRPTPNKGRLAPLPPMGGGNLPEIPMGGGNAPSIPMGGGNPAPLE